MPSSVASDPSTLFGQVCQSRYLDKYGNFIPAPPRIEKDLKDQQIEAGDAFKIKIPLSGDGPFEVKVKKDNKDVPENDRIKISVFDDFATLAIKGKITCVWTELMLFQGRQLCQNQFCLPSEKGSTPKGKNLEISLPFQSRPLFRRGLVWTRSQRSCLPY